MPSEAAGSHPGGRPPAPVGVIVVAVGLIAVLAGIALLPDLPTSGSGGNVEVVGGPAFALLYTGTSGRGWFTTAVAIAALGAAGLGWSLWARERDESAGTGMGTEAGTRKGVRAAAAGSGEAVGRQGRRWWGRIAALLLGVGLVMLVGGIVVIPRDGPAFQAVGAAAYAGVLRGRPWIEAGTVVAVLGAAWHAFAVMRSHLGHGWKTRRT